MGSSKAIVLDTHVLQQGWLMEEAGLAEPYRRLTEKPDHVPQWCSKHWLKAGERKGGGKHRRAS